MNLDTYLSEPRENLVEHVKNALREVQRLNQEYNCMNTICEERALHRAQKVQQKIEEGEHGVLAGLLVTVKDNICVKDVETTAGSRILQGYKPLFNATAVKRLIGEDAIIIGKTSMDAFGFGSFNINTGKDYAVPKNPLDKKRVTGGSSGGSAAVTKLASFPHISLGESTGGSIENPAAYCDVTGYCPTYGTVSRHGLISYANSLDKIGVFSREQSIIPRVYNVIKGRDKKDSTTHIEKVEPKQVETVGVLRPEIDLEEPVREAYEQKIGELEETYDVVEVSLPFTEEYGVPTYYIISMSEASTNLSKYSGLRYGQQTNPEEKHFTEYFKEIRSKHFNKETKRRLLLGTYTRMEGSRDDYYVKAMKARTKIIQEYKDAFKKVDVLISPTMPNTPPTLQDAQNLSPAQTYAMDTLTVGPNLAGIPHTSTPLQTKGLPVGLLVMMDQYKDNDLHRFIERL